MPQKIFQNNYLEFTLKEYFFQSISRFSCDQCETISGKQIEFSWRGQLPPLPPRYVRPWFKRFDPWPISSIRSISFLLFLIFDFFLSFLLHFLFSLVLFIYNVCFQLLSLYNKNFNFKRFFSGNNNYSFFSQIGMLFFPKNILTTSQEKKKLTQLILRKRHQPLPFDDSD